MIIFNGGFSINYVFGFLNLILNRVIMFRRINQQRSLKEKKKMFVYLPMDQIVIKNQFRSFKRFKIQGYRCESDLN